MTTAQAIPARTAVATRPAKATARLLTKPSSDDSGGGFKLFTWLKLYWLMILFCGSLIGAPIAYIAWMMLPSKYESYALLRVASSPFSVSNSRDPQRSRTDFTTYLKTNAQLIKNEFVLNKALGKVIDGSRISDLQTIQQQKNPFQFLDEELMISTQEGSEIIRLSMKGNNPDDLRKIINAVQAAYMEEVIEKEIEERKHHLSTVESTLVNLQQSLNQKTIIPLKDGLVPVGAIVPEAGAPLALPPLQALPLNVGAPGVVPAVATVPGPPEAVRKMMTTEIVRRVITLRQQVNELPLAIQSQQRRVAMLDQDLKSLLQGPASKETILEVENDPDVQALAAREANLRRKYQRDRALYSNPNVPSVTDALAHADRLAGELKTLREKKIYEREVVKRQASGSPLKTQYDDAMRRVIELQERLKLDQDTLAQVEKEFANLPGDPLVPVKAEEVIRLEQKKEDEKKPLLNPDDTVTLAEGDIFRGLAGHAASLRLDISSPKRVTVLQTASTPMQKDTRKQYMGTAVAGLVGFGLMGLFVVAYETRAKKLCGLSDLTPAGGLPVVGVIPWHPGLAASRPEVSEAVDRLRAYVTQTWLARGATTVAVTSAIADEGRSFTAYALARSLAEGGVRTLLVDFDLRHPSIHTLAGVSNLLGVCELLRGEADFRQTLQALPFGLHLLTAGKWSDDARRSACGGRLEQLLARLREPFECVVIHSNSLLTNAETLEVARRCEVVLLTTQYRETRLPHVGRATERLASMEIPHCGMVYLGATAEEALC